MYTNKYLQRLFSLGPKRTKEIFNINPTITPLRKDAKNVSINAIDYNTSVWNEYVVDNPEECKKPENDSLIRWINVDGLRKTDVEAICNNFEIHYLIFEDILSLNQRPKMDEGDEFIYFLLNMLYYDDNSHVVVPEQISILLGSNYVISFQEDNSRNAFSQVLYKFKATGNRIRQNKADYLCYVLIDVIVDNYFVVMEKLSDRIELLEEEIIRVGSTRSLARINSLRKELIVLKRNVAPVRDLISSIIRSNNDLIDERTYKYFKDIYDHIVQASDLVENYRDMMLSMQDLYLNKVNLRLNESMKVMAIVTCLLAPATVIGGIFGMNFKHIPYLDTPYGFYISLAAMLLIPVWMIYVFKKRGWF